jgi:hypothetical protein
MSNSTCLNCSSSEQERPLITIKFQGQEYYVCPQCLPILIHKPDQLADKLPGFQPTDYPSSLDD